MTFLVNDLQESDRDSKSGMKFDDQLVLQRFGPQAEVHLDMGTVAARNGQSLVSLEKFLQDRGKTAEDFPSQKLELVAAEMIGLQHCTIYPKLPAHQPIVSDAKNLCVLVSYQDPSELRLPKLETI